MVASYLPDKLQAEAKHMFDNQTTEHVMEVVLDHELHRHLCFRKPGTSMYWFDIITIPGTLIFQGDIGTFVFRRERDMFAWFGPGPGINPGYWAEKVTAGKTEEYSAEMFATEVTALLDEVLDGLDGLTDEQVGYYRANLAGALEDVSGMSAEMDYAELTCVDLPEGFLDSDLFVDTSFTRYTWPFLWCCHAVVYAIKTYQTTTTAGEHPGSFEVD